MQPKLRGKLVQFPIQNNLSGLPPKEQADCVADLVKAQLLLKNSDGTAPAPNNLGTISDLIQQDFTLNLVKPSPKPILGPTQL